MTMIKIESVMKVKMAKRTAKNVLKKDAISGIFHKTTLEREFICINTSMECRSYKRLISLCGECGTHPRN
jgi:hypothetical protein